MAEMSELATILMAAHKGCGCCFEPMAREAATAILAAMGPDSAAPRARVAELEAALHLADRALHIPPQAYNIDRAATLRIRQQARDAVTAALADARVAE